MNDENIKIDRKWAMPNKNTFSIKPIKELIEEEKTEGLWIDPFANTNKLANITNDLNKEYDTDYHMDALEFLKMFDDKSVDGVLFDPPYCYDDKTDVFTKDGWKNIKDISIEDEFATLNTKYNRLEYQKPEAIIKQRYEGKMIYINSGSINQLITPNHKVWAKSSNDDKFTFYNAKDMIGSKRFYFQKTANKQIAKDVKYFYLPETTLYDKKYGKIKIPKRKFNMSKWLSFFGIFLMQGSVSEYEESNSSKYNSRIMIKTINKRDKRYINILLKNFGYKYTYENYHFKIYDKQLWRYLSRFKDKENRYIPEDLKDISNTQLQVLLNHIFLNYEIEDKIYSKKLSDDITELLLKASIAFDLYEMNDKRCKTYYLFKILSGYKFKAEPQQIREIDFDDYVYCLTVPNHTLLIKRHGRVCRSGNSPRQVSESYKSFGYDVTNETTRATFWSNLKKEIKRIVKKDGKVISFGRNSGGIGKTNGFKIKRILLVAHGGWHNDTICTVEKKE